MEIPLFSKRPSVRPRSPEDAEILPRVRSRFSRAFGVFQLLKHELEGKESFSRDLDEICRKDCLAEIVDALASDDYHGFIEREFGCAFRLSGGERPALHAANQGFVPKLETRLVELYDRNCMERTHALGLGPLHGAATRFSRMDQSVWTYAAPLTPDETAVRDIRWLMACHASRASFRDRYGYAVRFQLPCSVTFYRSKRCPETGSILEQLTMDPRRP